MEKKLNNNDDLNLTEQSPSQSELEYSQKLFSQPKERYEEKYQEHYLDIYKMFVNTSEKISDRRQSNNSFFLTLNTAIIAFVSYLNLGEQEGESNDIYWVISLSGIIVCYAWYRLIKSYKQLNSGKFKIINLIEKKLPLAPYDAEWEALGRGKDPKLYLPFNKIEIIIPWIFFGIHITVLIRIFPWESIRFFLLSIIT